MNPEDILRFSKNIKLNKFGTENQAKLLNSKILIIGVGGLGLICAANLCANGIGTLGLVDNDTVDISNLHRQLFYTQDQVGRPKVEAAAEYLIKQNFNIQINKYNRKISCDNVEEIIRDYEVVVDCTDNLSTHLLINDACYFSNKRLVCAGANEYVGFVFSVIPGQSHCYRCMYPNGDDIHEFCSNNPVYGPLVNILGTIQASEVLKIIIKGENVLLNQIITVDLFTNRFRTSNFERNTSCSLCGEHATKKYIE